MHNYVKQIIIIMKFSNNNINILQECGMTDRWFLVTSTSSWVPNITPRHHITRRSASSMFPPPRSRTGEKRHFSPSRKL